jgi:hypothetical protein
LETSKANPTEALITYILPLLRTDVEATLAALSVES